MKKRFNVIRQVLVTTEDIWEAESEQEILDRLEDGTSLAGEISALGLKSKPGRIVKYKFPTDPKVKELN